jgi:hypothetical protein
VERSWKSAFLAWRSNLEWPFAGAAQTDEFATRARPQDRLQLLFGSGARLVPVVDVETALEGESGLTLS